MAHGKTYLLCVFVAAFGLTVTWKVCRPRDRQYQVEATQGGNAALPKTDTHGPKAFVFSNDSAADALLSHPTVLPASLGMLAPSTELVRQEGRPAAKTGEPHL